MFDPGKDAEPVAVKRCVRFWVEHCIFGIPIAQIAGSSRMDAIEVGEEVIRGANEAARYPTMKRCETLRTWIALAKSGDEIKRTVAKAHSWRLLAFYEEKTLFHFLHTEHSFSMTQIMEIFCFDD